MAICVGKNVYAQSYYQGMGGAGVSMVGPSEAAVLNPALLGYMDKNHANIFFNQFQYQPNTLSNKKDDKSFGLVMVDTRTSELIPGALSFEKQENEIAGTEARLYKLSLARREYVKASFGLALQRYEFTAPTTAKNEHDVNLGVTISPTEVFGISFVVDNLTSDGGDLLKKYYSLGLHYIYEPFLKFTLDLGKQDRGHGDSTPDLKTGFSVPIGFLDLSFGYGSLKSKDIDYFSGGLIWRGPRMAFSYAYRDLLGSRSGDGHFIDIGIFF